MYRFKIFVFSSLALVIFLSAGCASLSGRRESQWRYLKEKGIVTKPEQHRSPVAAAILNIIPGMAELTYLDLEDKSPGGYQFACCWLMGPAAPLSWCWSIPLAIHNTGIANIQHTVMAHLHEIPRDMGGKMGDLPEEPEEPEEPDKPDRPVEVDPYPYEDIPEKPKDFEPLPVEERPKVAVFNFEDMTSDEKKDFGKIVAEFFHTALFHTECFRVIERERINKVLQEQNFATSDMVDQSKAIEIGKLLKVEYILIGSVAKMGMDFNVSARMISVKTGETAAAAPTGKARREEDIDATVTSMANYLGSKFR